MIYKLIRPIVRLASKLYFRKIYIEGLENIPQGKPVILVSNHPTAFLEPCLYACFLPLDLHFLVRGDLFSKKWLSWLLVGTNQIPIFRYKDGISSVKKNLMTQEAVRKLFAENKSLLMFPEGHTHENLFLKPLKKGLSRFAFMDHGADVEILPVGVNFDRNVLFNSKVSLVVGRPLNVSKFKEQTFETESKMHRALLEEVSNNMKKCIRHIEKEDREEAIYKFFSFKDESRNEAIIPTVEYSSHVFKDEKQIASKADSNDQFYHKMQNLTQSIGFLDISAPSWVDYVFMLLLAPIFLFGLIVHGPFVLATKTFVQNKITAHEFKSPVFVGIMVFLYILIFLFGVIFGLIIHWKITLIMLALFVVGSLSILYYRAYFKKWKYLFSSNSKKASYSKAKENYSASFNIN